MSQTPRRLTLHEQLVNLLREGIGSARWSGELPSEAMLCREFQVSRMTLRKALAELMGEGWITAGGRGRLHRISRRRAHRETVPAKTIRLLTPFALFEQDSTNQVTIAALSARVASAGFRLEIEHHPELFKKRLPSKMKHLNALPDTAGWIILYATESIQRWFTTCGRPTVLIGRALDGMTFPTVFPDNEAAARHAAGLLHARGYDEMVYLIARLTSLGDRLASEAFVSEARRLGARARIVTYEMNTREVSRMVMDLIASRPRPTGWVIGAPEVAITLLCHLLAAGIRVPAEAGLIAMWDDHLNRHTFPTLAHYRTNGEMMGRMAGDLMTELLRKGAGKVESVRITPGYVSGGSVARYEK